MRVRMLESAWADRSDRQYLTSAVVDDAVAIDAGCLGLHSGSMPVAAVRHVFLTHSHLDHIGTLPIFIENSFRDGEGPVRIYGPRETLQSLREHLFNDEVWMDCMRLDKEGAWLELQPIEPESCTSVDGLRITAVPVDHVVPTFGYLLDDGASVVAFGADSGPTERIWQLARASGRLRAAFLECSFPDALEGLALRTGHLTPGLWKRELEKLPPEALAIAVHIKPMFREQVVAELESLGSARVRVGEIGREYRC